MIQCSEISERLQREPCEEEENGKNVSEQSAYLQEIEERNRQYQAELELLRYALVSKFEDDPSKKALVADLMSPDSGLPATFHISLSSCGAVRFENGIPKKENRPNLNQWDGRAIAFCSQDEVIADVAIGYAEPLGDGRLVLCIPLHLPPDQFDLICDTFEIYASNEHDGQTRLFCFDAAFSDSEFEFPDWAYHDLSRNSLSSLMTSDILHSGMVTFSSNSYVDLESLNVDYMAFIQEMMCQAPIRRDMFAPPRGIEKVEKWKRDAMRTTRWSLTIPSDRDEDMQMVKDIVSIWTRLCRDNHVSTVFSPSNIAEAETVREHVRKLGKLLAVEAYIDSYLSGVPLEDVLA